MIYIDVTDFLLYVRKRVLNNSAIIPTGIERVVMEYAVNGINLGKVKCVYYSIVKHKYLEVPNQIMLDIYNSNISNLEDFKNIDISRVNILRIWVRYRSSPMKIIFNVMKYSLSKLLILIKGQKFHRNNQYSVASFLKDDVILFLCAPAILRKYGFLSSLKEKFGVKLVMFIHDLMPLTLKAEYIPSIALTKETDFFVKKSLNIMDHYLVATNYWKQELHKYFKQIGKNAEVSVVKFGFGGKTVQDVPPIVAGKFIITVSTIEVRKNHITLVKAWHELLKQNMLHNHKLVIIGKWGWKVEPLKQYLEENNELQEHIVILNNIDDNNLASLYKNCSFTVFPSVAEGYGLPVVESLYYHKLCIVSDNPVMKEVCGKSCCYFDTFDVQDLTNKLSHYLQNPEMLQKDSNKISKAEITSWQEASQHLYQTINNI